MHKSAHINKKCITLKFIGIGKNAALLTGNYPLSNFLHPCLPCPSHRLKNLLRSMIAVIYKFK